MVPYFSFFQSFRSARRVPSRPRPGRPRRALAPPRIEPLEDRWLLSTIIDLGANVSPKAINASGQVVGDVLNGSQTHAFFYSNGTLTDLGTVAGFTNSHANALNDNGKVVGSLDNGTGSVQHALLYNSQNGNLTDRGTAPGYTDGSASGINDFGQASGNADMGSGTANHGFLYSQGTFDDLGPGFATAINASGQVAGGSNLFTDGQRTVLGSGTTAYGLNDPGQVVGSYITLRGGDPFLWTPTVPNGTTGNMAFLPLLPGENSGTAYGINAAGQVVGYNQGEAVLNEAFLYSNGATMNLNDFLPSGLGWQLARAKAINDAGQIVGTGYLNGDTSVSHGFLLDLNAAPATHGAGVVPPGDLALVQVTAALPAGTVREQPLAPSSAVLRDQPAGAAAVAIPVVIPGTPVAAGPASTPTSPTPTAVDLSSAGDLDLSTLMSN